MNTLSRAAAARVAAIRLHFIEKNSSQHVGLVLLLRDSLRFGVLIIILFFN